MRAAVADSSLAATLRVTHAPQPYIVQGGDTFMSIARKFGILPRMITAANPDVDAHALSVGQEITIPSPTR
ncbi:MAG: LysM peptidoglycan-binding domain-containing protein [Anaerolineae bacterium]|nr:LysM peptidoglycan-binding domain-containing protein [Anaerolineae bacterium]